MAKPLARRILDDYYGTPREPWPEWWYELPYFPVAHDGSPSLKIPEGATGG